MKKSTKFSLAFDILALVIYTELILISLPLTPYVVNFFDRFLGRSLAPIVTIVIIGIAAWVFGRLYRALRRTDDLARAALIIIFFIYLYLAVFCLPITSEKFHLIEYAAVGYLAFRITRRFRSEALAYLSASAIIAAIGCADEFAQMLLPNRVFDTRDIYINIVSGLLALLAIRFLAGKKG